MKWQLTHITKSGNQIGVQDGYRMVWAIRYHDGRIAYDYPEILPAYIKNEVEKTFVKMYRDKVVCSYNNCKYCKDINNIGVGYCRHMNGHEYNIKNKHIKTIANHKNKLEVTKCSLYSSIDKEKDYMHEGRYRVSK